MKKISTVLIAMLLLTLSVLAAHADQEGNARWCNIDNDGCYLNEEGGVKSYMYFWTVESCKFFMGNDDPCKNVVPRYYSADGRHPLEPAPEPVVYKAIPKAKPITIEEILEEMTEEEIRELLEEVLPEEQIETVIEYRTIPVTLVQMLTHEQVLDIMFPHGAVEFNGVMIVTGLEGLQEEGNQRLVSLEAAGSSKEVLIPVYLPKEGFSEEDFHRNFDDHRPMTAELSERGKSILLSGSSVKDSFLIPFETEGEYADEMNTNLNNNLKENFVLAGFVSSSGVGVAQEEERPMEGKDIQSGNEESSGSVSDGNPAGSGVPVRFSQNEFNKNADSTSLDTKDYWEQLGEKSTEDMNKLENFLPQNSFGAMLMRAMGIFKSEETRIVSGTPGEKKVVPGDLVSGESRIPDDSELMFVDRKVLLEYVKLQSGMIIPKERAIDEIKTSDGSITPSSGARVVPVGEGTALTFNTNDLSKAGPVVIGDEGQVGTIKKPLAGAILEEYKSQQSAHQFRIPSGGGTRVESGKDFEVHLYKENLESENFMHKFIFGEDEKPGEDYIKWVKEVIGISDWYQPRP